MKEPTITETLNLITKTNERRRDTSSVRIKACDWTVSEACVHYILRHVSDEAFSLITDEDVYVGYWDCGVEAEEDQFNDWSPGRELFDFTRARDGAKVLRLTVDSARF